MNHWTSGCWVFFVTALVTGFFTWNVDMVAAGLLGIGVMSHLHPVIAIHQIVATVVKDSKRRSRR